MSKPLQAKGNYGSRVGDDEDVSTRPSDPLDRAQPSPIPSSVRPSSEQISNVLNENGVRLGSIYSSVLHHHTLNYPIACDGFQKMPAIRCAVAEWISHIRNKDSEYSLCSLVLKYWVPEMSYSTSNTKIGTPLRLSIPVVSVAFGYSESPRGPLSQTNEPELVRLRRHAP
jgi:hypothetical protein